ncbi:MAG: 3-isopropylmalate dehydrogenase [Fusobacteriaceae bacterium]
MEKHIAVINGDGIGPEIIAEAKKVLNKVAEKFGHTFKYTHVEVGGCAIDKFGVPLPPESLKVCLEADSVLLGAVGGPKWDKLESHLRPEKALLGLRKEMKLFSNIRPSKIYPQLAGISPLRKDIVEQGIDMVVVRELTGGLYFGEHKMYKKDGIEYASDEMVYNETEVERVARVAFDYAMKRRKKLCSIDKANVLDSSKLWRKVVEKVAKEFPQVEYSDMLVDNAAMQLVKNPAQFDVIVTENMFGDILSDESSMITGSIGLMPSSSLGVGTKGIYEPIHGSAPDIAGKNIANPIGTILSVAMMLRYSFDLVKEADSIEKAVNKFLDENYRTWDIFSDGMKKVSCSEAGDIITGNL